ncbi:MAG: DUF1579 domain-containing protein [Candidatus Eisenbacteria bacterium]|nr:DUF1579 domain-containing protein [Candidatus Eisenbacteria bacterium]
MNRFHESVRVLRGLSILSGLVLALGSASIVRAQEAPGGMSEEEMMKKMTELATPGEQHQRLARLVGNWKTSVKMWMGPGEPTTSSGTATCESVLGGRYVQSRHTGNFGGMPFEGLGIDGYDNAKKQYFSAWFDNMGTGMMTMTGQPSSDGDGMTYTGTSFEPMQGRDVKIREEVRWLDPNKYVFTMYMEMPGQDGKLQEMRVMEMTAERQ